MPWTIETKKSWPRRLTLCWKITKDRSLKLILDYVTARKKVSISGKDDKPKKKPSYTHAGGGGRLTIKGFWTKHDQNLYKFIDLIKNKTKRLSLSSRRKLATLNKLFSLGHKGWKLGGKTKTKWW